MYLVDSHTHLEIIDELDKALERAKENGVSKIITIGTSIETSKKAIEIASTSSVRLRLGLRGASKNIPEIYATCGIHPHDGKADVAKFGLLSCLKTLKQLIVSSKSVVGVGEAGLDYYLTGDHSKSSKQPRQATSDEEKEFQKELFKAQVKLAGELGLPLIIHCRNAWSEIFDLVAVTVKNRGSTPNGVFHSWTGNWQAAKHALDLGFYISFSGIVTFKNAPEVQEVAKKMPLDRMLIETDSPFLAPEPIRSGSPPKLASRLSSTIRTRLEERNRRVYQQNEPKNVKIIAEFIASLRNVNSSEIAQFTSDNAAVLFKI